MKSKINILLIEDNEYDADMTIRTLKKNDLAGNLLHLKNGAEALDFLFAKGAYSKRQIENTPKVILLDLKMPKVSGTEVLRSIKSDERTKKIPVVVLTSSKEDADLNDCYSLGANSYVVKPVDFSKFQEAITNLGIFWLNVNLSLQ